MAPADHPFCSISGDAGSRAAATPPLPGIACALEFTTVVVGASARLDLSLHPRRRVLLHACCSAARAGMASSVSGAEHLDCEAQHDPFVDRRSEDDTSSVDCEARRNIRDDDNPKRKSDSTLMARSLVVRNSRCSSAGYRFFAPGMLDFRRYISSNRETLGDNLTNDQHGMPPQLEGANLELPTPRNTLTFSLDGSPQEVLNNYKRLINEIRLWNYCNGMRVDLSPLYGNNKFVYTTPELYLAVKEGINSAIFVIEGRGLWLKGFWTKNGLYEMLPDEDEDSFIVHPKCKFLRFKGNYASIGAGEPGRTEIGLYKLRKALHSVIQYRGVSPEPENFRTSINLFIQYLCEAPKLDSVFYFLCKSIIDESISSLDKAAPGVSTLMRKWSKLSKKAMRHIDFSLEGNPPVFEPLEELTHLDSIEKVLETVRILHLSYDKGVFKHSPIKRPVTWDPIDEGEGDTDVVGIPNYSSNNYNENLDHKRRDKKKNRRKEKIKDNTTVSHVRGGQPGGAPASKDLELLQCWKSCQEVVYSSAKACSKPFCSMRQIYSQPNYIQKRNFSSMRISGRGHLLKFAQSIEAPRTTQNTKRAVILPENRLINCDMGMPKDPLCNMARGHITKTSKYRHVRLKTEVKEKITSLQIHEQLQFVCLKWASRDLHLVTQTSLKAHSECISMMDRVLKWTNIQFLRYSMAQNKFRRTLQKSQQHLLPTITQSLVRSPDSIIDNFQNYRVGRLSPQQQHLRPLQPQRRIVECEILSSKRKGCDFISRTLCRPSESIGMFDTIPSWTDIQFLKYSKVQNNFHKTLQKSQQHHLSSVTQSLLRSPNTIVDNFQSGRVQAEQSSQKKYLGPLRPQRKIAECQIPASCKRKGLEFIARALRSVRR